MWQGWLSEKFQSHRKKNQSLYTNVYIIKLEENTVISSLNEDFCKDKEWKKKKSRLQTHSNQHCSICNKEMEKAKEKPGEHTSRTWVTQYRSIAPKSVQGQAKAEVKQLTTISKASKENKKIKNSFQS